MPPTGTAVLQQLSRLDGVSRAWFEWSLENDENSEWIATLVVEAAFATDPNSPDFREHIMAAIADVASDALNLDTSIAVARLKVVPRLAV